MREASQRLQIMLPKFTKNKRQENANFANSNELQNGKVETQIVVYSSIESTKALGWPDHCSPNINIFIMKEHVKHDGNHKMSQSLSNEFKVQEASVSVSLNKFVLGLGSP